MIAPLAVKAANLDTRNKVTLITQPGADKLAVTINGKTGLWSSSYTHPTGGVKTTFRGVMIQKQNRDTGFLRGPLGSEHAALQLVP